MFDDALDGPSKWLVRMLNLTAWACTALVLGFGFQVAVVLGSRLRTPRPSTEFSSRLLDGSQGLSTAASLCVRNLGALAAFTALSFLIAGRVSRAARRAALVIAVAAIALVWWQLSLQAGSLADTIGASPWVLLLVLPHGPLELGAILLPLLVAVSTTVRGSRSTPSLGVLAVASGLLIAGALIEAFVSPVLVLIPQNG